MKKTFVLLIIIMILFTACQPTPETEVVQNKNDGELEAAIEATATQTPENAEIIYAETEQVTDIEVWKETVLNNDGGLFIEINAQIIVPKEDKLPVIRIQPVGFTQEQVDSFIQYFSQDGVIYSGDDVMTQEEILEIIISIQAEYAMFLNGDEEFDTDTTVDDFEERIAEYQKMLEEAPTREETMAVQTTLVLNDDTGREELEIKINSGNEDFARISVLNRSQHVYSSTIVFSNGKRYSPDEDLYGQDAQDIDLTLEQVNDIAESTLDGLGLNDYSVFDIMTDSGGYIAICTPTINDVPVIYSDMTKIEDPNIIGNPDGSGSLVYADTGEIIEWVPRRFDECSIEISIDDTGVSYLLWSNVYETLSIENENVEILDFEKIKQIFLQQMENNFIYNNHENGAIYTVDRIELGLATIPIRNDNGYFYLVPAWTFYGSCETEDGETVDYFNQYGRYSSHLTINAIDGSIIAD